MTSITYTEAGSGIVRVTLPGTQVGAIAFTIGGQGSEFVHVISEGFEWRGRKYPGTIMLRRDSLTMAPGYEWMLKSEKGSSASWAVYRGISGVVSAIVLDCLEEHPRVLAEAERASLAEQLDRATKDADRLAEELVAARQAEDELRAKLAAASGDQS